MLFSPLSVYWYMQKPKTPTTGPDAANRGIGIMVGGMLA
jgi:hypothetical protein